MFDDGGNDGAAPTLAMLQTRLGESALQRVRRELTGTTGGSPHHYCMQPTPLLQAAHTTITAMAFDSNGPLSPYCSGLHTYRLYSYGHEKVRS